MYHMTTMVDNTIKLKFAKEVEIKCSYQKKRKKVICEVTYALMNSIGNPFTVYMHIRSSCCTLKKYHNFI